MIKRDLQKFSCLLNAECGEIDIRINGISQWHQEGFLIERIELVRFFATLLKKDKDGDYWLEAPIKQCAFRWKTFQSFSIP